MCLINSHLPLEIILNIYEYLPLNFNYYLICKSVYQEYANLVFSKFIFIEGLIEHIKYGYLLENPFINYSNFVKEIILMGQYLPLFSNYPYLPHATKLSINHCHFNDVVTQFPNIQSLEIDQYKTINFSGLNKFHHLNEIHFSESCPCENISIQQFKSIPLIKNEVDLTFYNIHSQVILLIPIKFPKFSRLSFVFTIECVNHADIDTAIQLIQSVGRDVYIYINEHITIQNSDCNELEMNMIETRQCGIHLIARNEMDYEFYGHLMTIPCLKPILSNLDIHKYTLESEDE
eukprot:NODE_1430_length_1083_cov_0.542683.p1 type:complete len:290 gc:universal NODE_1430_length_1083_cov_0.542683:174-1043(+)